MGAVYKARDRKLGRIVALKFIRSADPRLTRRFIQEARAQARIEHDHICKVYEVGEIEGHAFISMQYMEGQPLSAVHPRLRLEDKIVLLATVAEAIHAAHRQGIIHRDIKPSNIMVTRREDGSLWPVVMDFGLAHDTDASQELTQSGALLGTPQYMPPEQARGEVRRIDRRSDVYSLGALLYVLLTGGPPFTGGSMTDILLKVLDAEPRRPRQLVPDIPADLETIALKCLQKEPGQRYDSARAMALDLRRYLDGEPILGRPIPFLQRAVRWARKRPALVTLGAVVLLGTMSLGGIWLRAQRQAQELAAQAQLAEQLGQDVKEMELFMRVGYMMPLHDISAEKDRVRARMRDIEQRLVRMSAAQRGPAEYALGRGHLALREYPAALGRLQRAFQLGYRVADVDYALGRTFGGLYKLKLEELERSSDAEYRKRERIRIETELLTPAREHLQRIGGARLEAPEYIEGLLALYSQRPEAAAQRAEAVLRQHPWQYEAHLLAGDAWATRKIDTLAAGYLEVDKANVQRALASYQAASDMARSDASIYEAEASQWARLMDIAVEQGGDPRAAYQHGLLACDHALRADPASIPAYESKIRVLERWASHLYFRGEDTSEVSVQIAEVLKKSLQAGTVGAIAHDAAGSVYVFTVNYKTSHGQDPLPSLRLGRESFQKSVAMNPNHVWAWNDWAALELLGADWLSRNGGAFADVTAAIEESARKFAKAAELDPSYQPAWENLIDLNARLARLSILAGKDPGAFLAAAARQGQNAIRTFHPDFMYHNNRALIDLAESRYRQLSGQDPGPVLARVEANVAKALSQKGDYPEPYQSRAEAHLIAATRALGQSGNVASEVELGLGALAARTKLSPNDSRDETLRARLLLVRARWLVKNGRQAAAEWQGAYAAVARALELDGEDPEARLARAEVARHRIELGVLPPAHAEQERAQGLLAAERVLRQQPWNGFARAAHSALLLLRARGTHLPAPKQKIPDHETVGLSALLKENPLLAADYGSLLGGN